MILFHTDTVFLIVSFFFFFQAEDGIRDLTVTGVQTCALPILAVPPDILQEAAATPIALESYPRLHSIVPGEGVIGRVWQTAQSVCFNELSQAPELAKLRDTAFGTASIMAASLSYGKQDLGVLAVANGPMGAPFSQ